MASEDCKGAMVQSVGVHGLGFRLLEVRQRQGVGSCHQAWTEDQSPEEIHLLSLPIKESESIGFFLGTSPKDEVLKIMPVQKQFKDFVTTGDYNGHVGLVVTC